MAVTRGSTGSNPNEAETPVAYHEFYYVHGIPHGHRASRSALRVPPPPLPCSPAGKCSRAQDPTTFPFLSCFRCSQTAGVSGFWQGGRGERASQCPSAAYSHSGCKREREAARLGLRLQLQGMLCPRQSPRPGCLGAPSSCRAHSLVPGAGEAAHLRAPSQHRAGRPSAQPGCPPHQGEDGGAGRHEGQQPQEASCCREGGEDKETLPTGHGAGAGRAPKRSRGHTGKGSGAGRWGQGSVCSLSAQGDGEKGI